jgi:predicted NAD/FAD-dependent oxidoreductase
VENHVVVIGAGIAGLSAARVLRAEGLSVRVTDKGRGVGGRMASRRIGDARFDHGAQFFTVRSAPFAALVDAAKRDGAVAEWTHGFQATPDGHARWRGTEGMTSLCKWMAADAGIEPELGSAITDLRDSPADAFVLTPPVPQSMAILSFSGLLPDPATATRLARIAYKPTIAVLATLDHAPTGMPAHGGRPFDDGDDLAFVTDNQAKGISSRPALTVHLSNDRSQEYWSRPDDDVVEFAADRVASLLGDAAFVAAQVQRWRYAGPVEVHPEPTVVWGRAPILALAGEAFAGPKVEGAFLSGIAAAEAVLQRIG